MKEGKLRIDNYGATIKVTKRDIYNIPSDYLSAVKKLHNKIVAFISDKNRQVIKLSVDGEIVFDDSRKKNVKASKSEANTKKPEKSKHPTEKRDIFTPPKEVVYGRSEGKNNRFRTQTAAPDGVFLPNDTKQHLGNPAYCDNYHLKLNRFSKAKDGKFEFANYLTNEKFTALPPDLVAERHYKTVSSHFRKEYLKSFTFNTQWNLVVGLGTESVHETSMTLHHIYGIPYIPASAVKGVVRSWIITNHFNNSEEAALKDQGFCLSFGCPAKGSFFKKAYKGGLVFMDAFPVGKISIKKDIINPHYSKYYSGGDTPPADYLSPVPVNFLIVHNTKFKFLLGTNENKNITEGKFVNKSILEIGKIWLPKALKEHGIGAKTAVGYGLFK